jgi:hypothetical protein
MGLGYGIRDPENLFWIAGPGVKKAPDPGSATLLLQLTPFLERASEKNRYQGTIPESITFWFA